MIRYPMVIGPGIPPLGRSLIALSLLLIARTSPAQPAGAMRQLPPFADSTLDRQLRMATTLMNGFHGDSAMSVINAAMSRIDADERPEEMHYLLCYRAEILYYEGLFNEAMRDLNKAERLAKELKDSTLVANAYNLKGLLHENIQDSEQALPYLRLALQWFPEQPASRYPVSELHHIHGNMGTYLTTVGRTDSARSHLENSLELATRNGNLRGIAVARWGLGNLLLRTGDPLGALAEYDRSWAIADSAKDHDIGVDALVGRGLSLAEAHLNTEARSALERALVYLDTHRDRVGLATQRNLARAAAKAYERLGDPLRALALMAEWHHMDSTISAKNIRTALSTQALLLKADGDLALERVESARVAEQLHHATRTRSWVIAASLLALAAISIIYLVNSARQRHKQRLAEVEAEHAQQERTIAELRIREQVSRDLHDDLGVGLSALKLRSEMSVRQDPEGPSAGLLREQAGAAEELITSMRDIIWALQDDQGSLDDLVAYISSHARNYLDAHGLHLVLALDERWPAVQLSTQQRRNIFLVMKEALHNVVKHARAREVTLGLRWDQGLLAEVIDDGGGLSTGMKRSGHGLTNMQRRAQQVGGVFRAEAGPRGLGTRIVLHVPCAVNES